MVNFSSYNLDSETSVNINTFPFLFENLEKLFLFFFQKNPFNLFKQKSQETNWICSFKKRVGRLMNYE